MSAVKMKCPRSVAFDCVSEEEKVCLQKWVEKMIRNAVESYVYVCVIDVIRLPS